MSSNVVVSTALVASLALAAGSAAAQAPVLLGAPTVYKIEQYNQCNDLSLGDVNDDGRPDVVVAMSSDIREFLGRGGAEFEGSFVLWENYPMFNHRIALADLDGDGQLDLVVASNIGAAGNGFVSVLMGHGDGTFGTPTSYAAGPNVYGLLVADLSGDGVPDVAAAGQGSPGMVSVRLGLGGGVLSPPTDYPVGNHPRAVADGDFNADGVPDLVISDSDPAVYVLLGQGGGTFGATHEYTDEPSHQLAVGDVTGDGKQDVVGAEYSGTMSVLPGLGDGSFGAHIKYHTIAFYVNDLALADLNGDGFLDVALTSTQTDSLVVLSGDGAGHFGVVRTYSVGKSPWVVKVADFSGDATPDLAVGDLDDKTVAVLLNQGPNGDPWTWFGFGLDGGSGVPSLTGNGPLVAGTPTTMTLDGARPDSSAALFISTASQPTPFKGGTLVTVPVIGTLIATTDGVGSAQWAWPAWPANVTSGTPLLFQCAIADPAAPHGVALSSALQAVSP